MKPHRYLQRIRAEFPDIHWKTWRIPCLGIDHFAVVLDEHWLFRFAKKPKYKRLFVPEARLLTVLQKRVDLRLPKYVRISRDGTFGGYELIQGTPLKPEMFRRAPLRTRQQIIRQLAQFLSQLHALPLHIAEQHAVPVQRPSQHFAECRRDYVRSIRPHLSKKSDRLLCEEFFDHWREHLHDAYTPVFTHNDLSYDHILANPKRLSIVGIIDFGERAIFDPAADFAALWEYGESFVRQVYEEYTGPKDAHFLERSHILFQRFVLYFLLFAAAGKFGTWDWAYRHFKRALNSRFRSS